MKKQESAPVSKAHGRSDIRRQAHLCEEERSETNGRMNEQGYDRYRWQFGMRDRAFAKEGARVIIAEERARRSRVIGQQRICVAMMDTGETIQKILRRHEQMQGQLDILSTMPAGVRYSRSRS
ncbi:MAG: hypothetical protein ACLTCB_07530 [Merdibacter sp.]